MARSQGGADPAARPCSPCVATQSCAPNLAAGPAGRVRPVVVVRVHCVTFLVRVPAGAETVIGKERRVKRPITTPKNERGVCALQNDQGSERPWETAPHEGCGRDEDVLDVASASGSTLGSQVCFSKPSWSNPFASRWRRACRHDWGACWGRAEPAVMSLPVGLPLRDHITMGPPRLTRRNTPAPGS